MNIAITGHRPNKLGNEYDGKGAISTALRAKLERTLFSIAIVDISDPPMLITGMALGVDMLWAELAIDLGYKFIAAIPCIGQERMWPIASRERYYHILSSSLCTKHLVHNGPYNNSCMQRRNVWMVDNCDLLISVWDGSAGGTANCTNYATTRKRTIIRIDPRLLTL